VTNAILTRLSSAMLHQHYASGFWQDDTVYALARRHAEATPEHPAVRDRLHRHNYRQLVEMADRLAALLEAAGLRAGERVAAWLPSRFETIVALLACSRNRYVFCPSLHRSHTTAEIVDLLNRVRATAFIGETGFGADADRCPVVEAIKEVVTLKFMNMLRPLGGESGPGPWQRETLEAGNASPPSPGRDANTVLYLAFTSGTTGQPKGVMHSDNTLLGNSRAMAADWNLNARSVIYTLSPLSHNLGFGAMITSLLIGSELVVHDLPGGSSIIERIGETGATYLVGVPTHANDILRELETISADHLQTLKGFRISGAPVPRHIAEKLLDHGIVPQSGYGMTEACSHHYTLPTDDPELIVDSSGRCCPGYEIKVWSSEDPNVDVPPRTIGQIGGRGASLMLGYFDDQQATEESFNRSGWFMTGDLGWVDENGYVRITGRKKDVIIRGGHNIYPARIESLAMRHAAIERVAALPVADERLGEKVCVAFMLRKGHALALDQLLAHLDSEGLSRFDMPEYLVEVSDMPVTPSGKVLKRSLVDQIQAGTLVPIAVRWTRTDGAIVQDFNGHQVQRPGNGSP